MDEEAAFLQAIADNPNDDTARLAFADWLEEHDDPRGPWVRSNALWEWMAPDAKDPTETILARVRRGWSGGHLLGQMGPTIVPRLLEELTKIKNVRGLSSIQYALEQIGPSSELALPVLLKALKHKEKQVRHGAFRCIKGLVTVNDEARQITLDALDGPDKELRQFARQAFTNHRHMYGESPDPKLLDAVPKLRMFAIGGDRDAALESFYALKTLQSLDESLIPSLLNFLRSPEAGSTTAYVLQDLGVPAVQPILDVADKLHGPAVWRATEALENITKKHPDAIPILQKALKGRSPAAQQFAAKVLAQVAPETNAETLPSLIEALRSDDQSLRYQALEAIHRLGPAAADALPVLIELLRVETHSTWHLTTALSTIGPATETAIPDLLDIVA